MIGPAEIEDMLADYAEAVARHGDGVPAGHPVWLSSADLRLAANEERSSSGPDNKPASSWYWAA